MEAIMQSFITMLGDAFPDIEPKDPLCKQLKELVAGMNINPQFSDIAIKGIVQLCEEDPAAMKVDMEKVKDKLTEIVEEKDNPENPSVEIRDKSDRSKVYYKDGLYQTLLRLVYQGNVSIPYAGDVDVYLNGEKVDMPVEMEEVG